MLSTSNRLSRVVDRVRELLHDAEDLAQQEETAEGRRRALIESQLRDVSRRMVLLRSALAALYMAIGFFVATSIGVGLFTFFGWEQLWVPTLLGMLGVVALFWGTVLLVSEARIAIASTLDETRYIDAILSRDRS